MTADAAALRVVMNATASSTLSFEAFPFLRAVVMMPVPKGFVKMSASLSCTPTLQNFVRMNDPRDGYAVFDFFVDNAVASYNNRAALFDFIGAAFENLVEDFHLHLTLWEANDVHRRFGFSTHGVNVAQRIRGGDLTEDIRIVNDGREKIHRVDDDRIGTQPKYP